ncbi:MAG: hypothetical protein FWC71_08535 [Defluviitaleaceae bacterium]|nr:hypothetical protein [Defluviitaleaceae bacterium]
MLNTPLGEIIVKLNDRKIPFCVEKLENIHIGQWGLSVFAVDGRYKILVDIANVKTPLSLTCQFDFEAIFHKSSINSGERLALKTWENGTLMFSIGSEDEIDETSIEYLEYGIKVYVEDGAKVDKATITLWGIFSVGPKLEPTDLTYTHKLRRGAIETDAIFMD